MDSFLCQHMGVPNSQSVTATPEGSVHHSFIIPFC